MHEYYIFPIYISFFIYKYYRRHIIGFAQRMKHNLNLPGLQNVLQTGLP